MQNQLNILSNFKCIVTGGPTREWLDPVRFISNPSTGKMGIAIADALCSFCNEIVFVHGPISQNLLNEKKYRTREVDTTNDLLDTVLSELHDNCLLIMAAAPVDYSPIERSKTKIKKNNDTLEIKLKKNVDILKYISVYKKENHYKKLITVGFAAETNNLEEYALKKLIEKDLDLICVNDVSRSDAGFGSNTNIITVYDKNKKSYELSKMTKYETAQQILKIVENYIKMC